MDFFTVIVIGFAIYSFIEKVKHKNQPGRPISERQILGRPRSLGEMFSGGDSKPNTLMDMLNQWIENQNPKRFLESKQFPERNFSSLSDAPDLGTEESTQTSRYGGSLGGVSTQGEQGVEGLPGIEGLLGVEGTSLTGKTKNYQEAKAGLPPEVRALSQPSALDLDLHLRERELMQGIVWAEVLGRPRALRPFRTSR
ncbi:MAG: hypothetical protein WA113_07445 [Desulfitobacteriaceae bacterium]